MGCPRYIGRGRIFSRLVARQKAQVLELKYFSFCVVEEKKHELAHPAAKVAPISQFPWASATSTACGRIGR
jgi:hypothetical protein